jgi:hypothetical protein
MNRERILPETREDGALISSKGIVCGRLSQYADALGTDPAGVLDAVGAAGVRLLVDTAKSKGREKHDRPTDPALRCLGMTREGFARLLAEVQRFGRTTTH